MKQAGFWQAESSGVLAPVVEKYLAGGTLDAAEVEVMRAYLVQWCEGFPFPDVEALAKQAAAAETHEQIEAVIMAAVKLDIDPL